MSSSMDSTQLSLSPLEQAIADVASATTLDDAVDALGREWAEDTNQSSDYDTDSFVTVGEFRDWWMDGEGYADLARIQHLAGDLDNKDLADTVAEAGYAYLDDRLKKPR